MCNIKSIEYLALRQICDVLSEALKKGDLNERASDQFIQSYIRELRTLARGLDLETLPHEFSFYCDLFSAAFGLLTKRNAKDREMY